MKAVALWFGFLFASIGVAQDIITVEKSRPFDQTLAALQQQILNSEYKISIIQRCDFGLQEAGFKSEKYRVVYFGKHDEVKALSDKYPALAPFLPLRIVVVAQGETSLLTSMHPRVFLETVTDPDLVQVIQRWQKDILQLLQKS